jgi:predicted RND superfamily exporter protein
LWNAAEQHSSSQSTQITAALLVIFLPRGSQLDDEFTVTRIVSLAELTEKVESILGSSHPISIRIKQASEEKNPDLMEEAMEMLDEASEAEREAVHQAVLTWLLGGDEDPKKDLMAMESPSRAIH